MRSETRIPPGHWLAGALVALALHTGLLLALGPGLRDLRAPSGVRTPAGGEAGMRVSLESPLGAGLRTATAPAARLAPPPPAPPVQQRTRSRAAVGTLARRPAPLARERPTASEPQPVVAEPVAEVRVETAAAFPGDAPGDAGASAGQDVAAGPAGAAAAGSGRAGAGASNDTSPVLDGEASDDYFDAVFARVQSALEYPRRARLERIEGTVVLRLRLDRGGRIDRMQVAESSGSLLLDRQAMRIVRRAAPFGPPPARLDDDSLAFELPLEFVLTDGGPGL